MQYCLFKSRSIFSQVSIVSKFQLCVFALVKSYPAVSQVQKIKLIYSKFRRWNLFIL